MTQPVIILSTKAPVRYGYLDQCINDIELLISVLVLCHQFTVVVFSFKKNQNDVLSNISQVKGHCFD